MRRLFVEFTYTLLCPSVRNAQHSGSNQLRTGSFMLQEAVVLLFLSIRIFVYFT